MKKFRDIEDSIFDLYIADIEEDSEEEASIVTPKLPMLASNDLAHKISGVYNPDYITDNSDNAFYKVICNKMIALDPSLKDNIRTLEDYETGGKKNSRADVSQTILTMTKNTLAPGTYYVKAGKKVYFYLTISVYTPKSADDDRSSYFYKENSLSYEFWIIGRKWKKYFDELVAEKDKYDKECEKSSSDWFIVPDGQEGRDRKTVFKSFDNLVMRDKDKVIKYIDNWVANIPYFYKKYNMISKLSVILYGEPGTGKSTFCQAVARYLGIHNIVPIQPNTFETKATIRSPFSELVPVIYSIDDIDCVCKSRDDKKSTKEDSMATANVLAFLDNPPTFFFKAKDGMMYPVSICIATTNYYDKLDPAVKRYGRFDLHIAMNEFDKELAEEMCKVYDLELKDVLSEEELNAKNFHYSPAKLQAMCLANIDKRMKEIKE